MPANDRRRARKKARIRREKTAAQLSGSRMTHQEARELADETVLLIRDMLADREGQGSCAFGNDVMQLILDGERFLKKHYPQQTKELWAHFFSCMDPGIAARLQSLDTEYIVGEVKENYVWEWIFAESWTTVNGKAVRTADLLRADPKLGPKFGKTLDLLASAELGFYQTEVVTDRCMRVYNLLDPEEAPFEIFNVNRLTIAMPGQAMIGRFVRDSDGRRQAAPGILCMTSSIAGFVTDYVATIREMYGQSRERPFAALLMDVWGRSMHKNEFLARWHGSSPDIDRSRPPALEDFPYLSDLLYDTLLFRRDDDLDRTASLPREGQSPGQKDRQLPFADNTGPGRRGKKER